MAINAYLALRNSQNFTSVPIRFQGEYWGNVYMEFDDDIDFDEAEMRMVAPPPGSSKFCSNASRFKINWSAAKPKKNMIWEMLTIPLLLTDLDRNVIRVNPAMERLTGKVAAEIVGLPCTLASAGRTASRILPHPPDRRGRQVGNRSNGDCRCCR